MSARNILQNIHRKARLEQSQEKETSNTHQETVTTPQLTLSSSSSSFEDQIDHKQIQEEIIEETIKEQEKDKQIPTSLKQIKRKGLSLDAYGLKPYKTNFDLWNYELVDFLTNFSKENQKHGGVPINKSKLMEIILDVIYYDVHLKPEGFQSVEELRDHLQHIIKKR